MPNFAITNIWKFEEHVFTTGAVVNRLQKVIIQLYVSTSGTVRMPLAADLRSYKDPIGGPMAAYMLIVIVFHCLTQRRVWGQIDRNFVSFFSSLLRCLYLSRLAWL